MRSVGAARSIDIRAKETPIIPKVPLQRLTRHYRLPFT
jgi:hypothetical protein